MEEILQTNTQLFAEPPVSERMAPFWFWNHELEEDELIRQLRDMAKKGIGGVVIHARCGLKTASV